MDLTLLEISGTTIAEVVAEGVVVATPQDGLDLIGNAWYLGAEHVLIAAEHLHPDFFDLRTGLAGEVLQKASNYRMRLTIIGDFEGVTSRSLQAFIAESNRGGLVAFVADREEAVKGVKGE